MHFSMDYTNKRICDIVGEERIHEIAKMSVPFLSRLIYGTDFAAEFLSDAFKHCTVSNLEHFYESHSWYYEEYSARPRYEKVIAAVRKIMSENCTDS